MAIISLAKYFLALLKGVLSLSFHNDNDDLPLLAQAAISRTELTINRMPRVAKMLDMFEVHEEAGNRSYVDIAFSISML